MGTKDPKIDVYIAKSADFAKPILTHIRSFVHAVCPDVEETLKWGFPHFMHKGILCSMASFKQHCAFGRITSLSDLPKDEVLIGYIKEAVRLNDADIKVPARTKPKARKDLVIPDDLTSALKQNQKAMATFESFTYSHKKEYVDWITEAKGEETRKRRLATAIQWMAGGKPRNWKYIKC